MAIHFSPSLNASRVSAGSLRPTVGTVDPSHMNLGIGEPDFMTPQPIIDAFRQSSLLERPGYGDFHGDPKLRELIAADSSRAAEYHPDNVLVTHGGTSAITATILATVSPGDRVIIPTPTYSLYADVVNLAGGTPVFVPMTAEHQLDLEALRPTLDGARMIVICNPGNPTGVILTGESLHALGEMLRGTDTLVFADEAYAHFDYDNTFVSMLEIPSLQERLIYCQTFSKTYSMTGWRAGYVVTTDEVIPWIRQVHRSMTLSINRATQAAAIAAMSHGPSLIADHVASLKQRRELIASGLDSIEGVDYVRPGGAFYIFMRYDVDIESRALAAKLREAGVVTRAGREFGESGEGHIRLAYAAPRAQIEGGLERIDRLLRELRG